MLPADDPAALSLVGALLAGDVEGLRALLAAHPGLAAERFGDEVQSRTALHVATDWPGQLPRVAETIAVLVAAGASVDARFAGSHRETALHWAASCDDVAAIDALLDLGADIEADGGVLTGGPPLDDAVIFEQWKAARRLVERGASLALWHAAALGEIDRLEQLLAAEPGPGPDEVTNAAWHACRAGQLRAAQILAARGADLDRTLYDDASARQAGLLSGQPDLVTWLSSS
ncbi:MAG: hypothetical protein R2761_29625 [Acidimicrobiales bacterium]